MTLHTSQIRVLSELTINQIAAGEVVENPASVVKELVENAYDAGATQIGIEIEGGGLQLIRVTDNGSGMSADDAVLCLERYATSKIRAFQDLAGLESMGFRGEALASIAAISKLTLTTALKQGVGTEVVIEGGKLLRAAPVGRSQGTTIEVRCLFYTVPARKKFQKSSASCAAEITRLVTRLALAWPDVGFTLISQGEEVLSAPALKNVNDPLQRAHQVLGKQFFSSPFQVFVNDGPLQIRGLIGTPEEARTGRHRQYLFVNKRVVSCPFIGYAIKDSYATRIAKDHHPVFLLYFTLSQDLVDINVHPQKKEIRFRDEQWIREKILQALSSSFPNSAPSLPQAEKAFTLTPHFDPNIFNSFKLKEPSAADFDFILQPELPLEKPSHRIIALFDTFLLVEENQQLVFVDLHAAHRRVLFDSLDQDPTTWQGQGLMIPLILEFSAAEAAAIQIQIDSLKKLGIHLRQLRNNTFIIETLPSFLDTEQAKDAVLSCTSNSAEGKTIPRRLVRFAKASKKGFMLQEAIALLEKLQRSPFPSQCPDGKAIMHRMGPHEIAHLFKSTP